MPTLAVGMLVKTSIHKQCATASDEAVRSNAFGLLSRKTTASGRGPKELRSDPACLIVALLVCLIPALWMEGLGPHVAQYFLSVDVDPLIRNHLWIAYEPRSFDPELVQDPDVDEMKKELEWIRNAGFDGVVTFSSRGNLAHLFLYYEIYLH